jgi:hypothetical protein
MVDGDVREPDAIIAAITGDIDLEASACLLMGTCCTSSYPTPRET